MRCGCGWAQTRASQPDLERRDGRERREGKNRYVPPQKLHHQQWQPRGNAASIGPALGSLVARAAQAMWLVALETEPSPHPVPHRNAPGLWRCDPAAGPGSPDGKGLFRLRRNFDVRHCRTTTLSTTTIGERRRLPAPSTTVSAVDIISALLRGILAAQVIFCQPMPDG